MVSKMLTLTKAIGLLGKRVYAVYVLNQHYGRVERGTLSHVTIHAEQFNRGEWHAYVRTKSSGIEYAGDSIYLTKGDAESEMKRRMANMDGGDTP